MRILFIIFDLFFITLFCFGMDTNYKYAQDANNWHKIQNPMSPQVFQTLSDMQRKSLKGIELSIGLFSSIYAFLSPRANSSIPASEYTKIDASLDTSLCILASFLEIAHLNGLNLAINPMHCLHNQVPYDFYPVSTAIDFLNIPLLLACKKHFPPGSLASSICFHNEKSINALTKYQYQEAMLFNICLEVSQKNQEILPYYLSQYAKLPVILSILLI